jgi:hypothetical protein
METIDWQLFELFNGQKPERFNKSFAIVCQALLDRAELDPWMDFAWDGLNVEI